MFAIIVTMILTLTMMFLTHSTDGGSLADDIQPEESARVPGKAVNQYQRLEGTYSLKL